MCEVCWMRDYDSIQSNDARVVEASNAIDRVYAYHLAGGGLHNVVDDWNLDDGSLKFCRDYIEAPGYDAEPERLEAERACIDLLSRLSEEERAAALALQEGFYGNGL